MTDSNKEKIIVLAPHTDDGEFGCGGTIARFINEGHDVYYVAFSSCEESVPKEFEKDILVKEVKLATQTLGVDSKNLLIYKFPVRKFPEYRQPILEKMVSLAKEIKPTMVLLPSINDTHQDHVVIAQEGFRAFKRCSMLGYEVPWNNLNFSTNCFFNLESSHLETKVRALKCYQSQAFRTYASKEFIYSLATVRGTQIGKNMQRYLRLYDG